MVGEKGQGALYSYSDGSPLYLRNKEGNTWEKISERTRFHTHFFFFYKWSKEIKIKLMHVYFFL